jgi:hypothetical protein
MGILTDYSSVIVSLGAEPASNAEENSQEAERSQQQWPPANAVDDEEGANIASDGERLCPTGNLEGFCCRNPGKLEVVGAIGTDISHTAHRLDGQRHNGNDSTPQVGASEAFKVCSASTLFACCLLGDLHNCQVLLR